MSLATLRKHVFGPQVPRPPARQCRRVPLLLEPLEHRSLPSAYTAASVADLIADIRAANQHGGSNTITLAANTTFTLTAVDNTADGPTGLPVIKTGNNLTLAGNGDTIERSPTSGTPAFRLFDVASGGALTLSNLTLQNGLAFGAGAAASGGAIYNQGTLDLNGVTVQANTAQGSDGKQSRGSPTKGQDAAGGGIWSNGALTLENGTKVQSNEALGGNSFTPSGYGGYNGGSAFGGGVYVAGGTANLTSATLSNNTIAAGAGGGVGTFPGYSDGGGLYVAAGTVSLRNDTVTGNQAPPSLSAGGGLFIAAAATMSLDSFTVNHTSNNTAAAYPDIYGSYTLQ
jgi:hypothetical protein